MEDFPSYKSLKIFFPLLLVSLGGSLFVFVSSARGHPRSEYKDCIESASKAINNKGIKTSHNGISKYCDCALKKIIDKKQT